MQINSQGDVSFNLKGREWISPAGEAKYFNTVEAWRVDKAGAPKQAIAKGNIEQNFEEEAIREMQEEDDSDLPF
jgi:hypothetical protein